MDTIVKSGAYFALPESTLRSLAYGDPQREAMIEQQGISFNGATLRQLREMKNKQEFVLYSGYTPQNGASQHTYFENQGAWATPFFTNIKNAGKIPFGGSFKVTGIGMYIRDLLTQEVADVTHVIDGYLTAKFGSQEGNFFQCPIDMLYSQDVKCCMTNASPSATPVTQLVSNTPYVGRNGYLALPSAPVIKANDPFNIEVRWTNAWAAEAGVTQFMLIFGKRYIPITDEVGVGY